MGVNAQISFRSSNFDAVDWSYRIREGGYCLACGRSGWFSNGSLLEEGPSS